MNYYWKGNEFDANCRELKTNKRKKQIVSREETKLL